MKTLVPHLPSLCSSFKSRVFVLSALCLAVLILTGNIYGADATQTTVTLTWTAPGDDGDAGTAVQYDVRYSTVPITGSNWGSAVQVTGEPTPQSAGSLETMTVTGLQPGTMYYFAIKAADEMPNWSALSNVVGVSTLSSDPPPAAVLTLSTSQVTASSVTLLWVAPGADSVTGTASQYDIRYSTSLITGANWDAATQLTGEPSPHVAGSMESFVVSGLSSGVRYYFALKTADAAASWSGLSNVASTTTGAEQVPPSDIANLSVEAAAPNNVTLTWTAPGDDGSVGTANRYEVRYAIWPITNLNWGAAALAPNAPTPQPSGSAEHFTVPNLNSGVTYYFAVRAADEVPNWNGLSNVVNTITADNIAPNPITDLGAEAGDNAGELILTWTATGDDGMNGTATQYLIAYSQEEITAANWQSATLVTDPPAPLAAGQAQTYTITGLAEATQYWVVMVAVDEADNNSGLSNITSGESGFEFGTGTDDDDPDGVPSTYELHQNYPNPFNPTTTIEYGVPEQSYVTLTVYNILGQPIVTLVDGEKAAGTYSTVWDGKDDNNVLVASGIYFYTIQSDSYRLSRKMVLMK